MVNLPPSSHSIKLGLRGAESLFVRRLGRAHHTRFLHLFRAERRRVWPRPRHYESSWPVLLFLLGCRRLRLLTRDKLDGAPGELELVVPATLDGFANR